jgi:hypothetical protein
MTTNAQPQLRADNIDEVLKAIDKLRTALPQSLQWLKDQGYEFKIFP